MKIIDKTPLVDEKGKLGFQQRIQGMLQFGFNWPKELEVQKVIAAYFERQLEKGYTLIRNVPLGASGIVIPMVLLGPAGIFVISISYLKGRYEAAGDSWNMAAGNGYKPAPVNVIREAQRMARALHAFIERQGTRLPAEIESVVIAGDPGLHIESKNPAVRMVMIDGIKNFVSGLANTRPVMGAESVFEMTERILNPRPPRKELAKSASPTIPPALSRASREEPPPQQEVSRARAIFNASEQARPFSPDDFDFAMSEEQEALPEIPPIPAVSPAAGPVAGTSKPRPRRILGMTMTQLVIILALVLCLISIVIVGFVYINPLGL